MDHMQPPRRLIGRQPPVGGGVKAVKPDGQILCDCAPLIRCNLKPADRAGVIVQHFGVGGADGRGGDLLGHSLDIIPTCPAASGTTPQRRANRRLGCQNLEGVMAT